MKFISKDIHICNFLFYYRIIDMKGDWIMDNVMNAIFDIPVIGEIVESIYGVPVIGLLAVIIIGLFFVNKLFITQFDINILKLILNVFKGRDSNKKFNNERKKFFEVTSSKEYTEWQNLVLEKIYDDLPLVELFGQKHMTVVQKAAKKISYPISREMSNFGKLKSLQVPDYKLDGFQQKYYNIMSANIKKPNLIGFELEQYLLNESNEITGFEANVCQYKHTVTSSHILEYEMYILYCKNKQIMNKNGKEILKALTYRNKIHEGQTNREVVLKGKNRHSLLSVQMMVICYDDKLDDYRVVIYKRSEDVAIKPNYWHIVPAGGFEIFEKEDMKNSHIIEENFDVQLALFRELLEELFNGKDFEDNEVGNDRNYIIYQHPVIVELENLLKEKRAHLDFLGNVTDLTTLRAELSFILVVDDPHFIKNKLQKNFEGIISQRVRVNDLEKMLRDDLLYPSSAGLIKLAQESPLFRKCIEYNENQEVV